MGRPESAALQAEGLSHLRRRPEHDCWFEWVYFFPREEFSTLLADLSVYKKSESNLSHDDHMQQSFQLSPEAWLLYKLIVVFRMYDHVAKCMVPDLPRI